MNGSNDPVLREREIALMVGTYIHCLIQTEQVDKVGSERVFGGEANFDSLAVKW